MSKQLEQCLDAHSETERLLAMRVLVQHTTNKYASFVDCSSTSELVFKEIWTNLNADGKYYERIFKVTYSFHSPRR